MYMEITIISDTICPWCFIGKRRLEQALTQRSEVEARIHWRPFFLNPDMPAGGLPRQEYLNTKFGGEANARSVYQRITAAARDSGLELNFQAIQRTPNTLDSHRLLHWAGNRQNELAEVLFQYYFQNGQDIGDIEVLATAALTVGLDASMIRQQLASDLDRDTIRDAAQEAHRLNIGGVPFFILDRRYGLSGAQPPEVIVQAIDRALAEHGTVDNTPTAPQS